MKVLAPIVILILISCSQDNEIAKSISPLDLSINEINQALKNSSNGNKSSLELKIHKILKNHRFQILDDKRILDILTDLRLEISTDLQRAHSNMKIAPPCSGDIASVEIVDLDHDEWIFVYHYEDGSTHYRWYDANDNVVKEECFGGSES